MLSSAGGLLVCSRGAVENASGLSRDILALGRHLRVDAILNGSLEALPSGELCLVLRLHSIQDGFQLWSACANRSADLFSFSIVSVERRDRPCLKLSLATACLSFGIDPVAIEFDARGRHLRQNWNENFKSHRDVPRSLASCPQRSALFVVCCNRSCKARFLSPAERERTN